MSPGSKDAGRAGSKFLILGLFLILSAAIRIYSLGQASYWIDEMVSLHFATRHQFGAIFWDNNPFLYHLLLKGWVKLVGEKEAWTRLLSVIFSVTTTGILFFFGDMVAGLAGACLMAAIHCFFPLSIMYAQETRMYALFEMAMALHLYFFYRFAVLGKKNLGYILTIPLLCLTQYLAAIPLFLEGVWFLTQVKDRKDRKWVLIGLGLGVGVLAASYLYYFSWEYLEWQKFKFQAEPQSRWPGRLLWVWCQQNLMSAAGMACLLVFSVSRMIKQPWTRRDQFFFLYIPLGSLALMWIDALVTSRGVFLPRYFIFTVPFVIGWITVTCMDLFRTRSLSAVGCLVLLFGGTIGILPQVYISIKSPWRETARYVTSFPGSIAFTTRTASLKTPYFENHSVDVRKWDPGREGIQPLLDAAAHFPNVWVLENFYGGIQYFDRLQASLKEKGFSVTEQDFKTETSEPVMVLRIRKTPENPFRGLAPARKTASH